MAYDYLEGLMLVEKERADRLEASLTSYVEAAHQIAQEMSLYVKEGHGLNKWHTRMIEGWAEAILALWTLPVDGK